MKHIHTFIALASVLLFIGCNSKTTKDHNTTAVTNPIPTVVPSTNPNPEPSAHPSPKPSPVASTSPTATPSSLKPSANPSPRPSSVPSTKPSPKPSPTSESDAQIKSLKLIVSNPTLNKDENSTVKVMATYMNNSTKDVTKKVEWVVVPSGAVKIHSHRLTALQDKATTLKAKLGKKSSNAVKLNITWIVNGHSLPPEPDPAVNDSTLLGIDSNKNGVRDDVERWIYEEYKDKHPIHIAIAMQAARGYKLVLETPEKAKEIRLKVDAALFCNWYYWKDAKEFNEPLLVNERIDTSVEGKYFNTKDRKDTYLEYDKLLSGGVYDSPWADEMKAFCSFDTSKYGK